MFRFSYEDRAWTAGQIVREIRSQLVPEGEHARADATLSEAAQAHTRLAKGGVRGKIVLKVGA